MQAITKTFEGHDVHFLSVEGRPAVPSAELARALGYSRADVLANLVRTRWAEEMIEGTDFTTLTAEEVAGDRRGPELSSLDVDREPSDTCSACVSGLYQGRPNVVLFEPGLYLVLLKTRRPAGVRLRRWLAAEVFPALRKTGSYALAPAMTSDTLGRHLDAFKGELEATIRRELRDVRREVEAAVEDRNRQLGLFGAPKRRAVPGGSPLDGWLDNAVEIDPEAREFSTALHTSFNTWRRSLGLPAVSARAFGTQLRKAGFLRARTSQARLWRGLRLRR